FASSRKFVTQTESGGSSLWIGPVKNTSGTIDPEPTSSNGGKAEGENVKSPGKRLAKHWRRSGAKARNAAHFFLLPDQRSRPPYRQSLRQVQTSQGRKKEGEEPATALHTRRTQQALCRLR